MNIKDKNHTVIIIEGEFKEGMTITDDMFKAMFVGDILSIGVGNYDKETDTVKSGAVLLGKYELLTRQHLVMGTMIHERFVESRKKKESE